jgi:hypothetical protein
VVARVRQRRLDHRRPRGRFGFVAGAANTVAGPTTTSSGGDTVPTSDGATADSSSVAVVELMLYVVQRLERRRFDLQPVAATDNEPERGFCCRH